MENPYVKVNCPGCDKKMVADSRKQMEWVVCPDCLTLLDLIAELEVQQG